MHNTLGALAIIKPAAYAHVNYAGTSNYNNLSRPTKRPLMIPPNLRGTAPGLPTRTHRPGYPRCEYSRPIVAYLISRQCGLKKPKPGNASSIGYRSKPGRSLWTFQETCVTVQAGHQTLLEILPHKYTDRYFATRATCPTLLESREANDARNAIYMHGARCQAEHEGGTGKRTPHSH